ncbi:LacI family DNA-binding transcriptional regulator [Chromobacterium haemolyticum]|nr:LacI family DNA-binding transcriptional regulator [Chromobacterium haemolyticum]
MRNRLSMSGYKRLTIDDIAELAGVSRTTASMVLNGHAERYRISRATVERVEKVAREQHFNPSQSARALAFAAQQFGGAGDSGSDQLRSRGAGPGDGRAVPPARLSDAAGDQ